MRRLLLTVTAMLTLATGVGSALATPGLPEGRHTVCVVFPATPDDPDPDGFCVSFEDPRG